MCSFEGSAAAAGDGFLDDLMTVMGGIDGLVGALFGSLGGLIGVGDATGV